jgi:hypothetical protein
MKNWKWNDGIEHWWKAYKYKMLQLIGSLIMEKDQETKQYVVSLGRISFWAALIPALHIWIMGKGMLADGTAVSDISPNHLTLLLSLLGYNFGKKASDTVNNIINIKNGSKAPPQPEDGPG